MNGISVKAVMQYKSCLAQLLKLAFIRHKYRITCMNISLNIDDLSTFVAVIQLFKKRREERFGVNKT